MCVKVTDCVIVCMFDYSHYEHLKSIVIITLSSKQKTCYAVAKVFFVVAWSVAYWAQVKESPPPRFNSFVSIHLFLCILGYCIKKNAEWKCQDVHKF